MTQLCSCAYNLIILIPKFIFLGILALFNFELWPYIECISNEQFILAQLLLNRCMEFSETFIVGIKDTMCLYSYYKKIMFL